MALELNKDGTVTQRPVAGWTVGPLAGVQVVLRLEYISQPGQVTPQDLQVVLTPAQAKELAQTLERAAQRCEQQTPGSQAH